MTSLLSSLCSPLALYRCRLFDSALVGEGLGAISAGVNGVVRVEKDC